MPNPLPPNPPLCINGSLGTLLENASTALGRLDGISSLLPDPALFLYTYVRKEAVLSSQIEGTQSSLSDLLRHEVNSTPAGLEADVAEVSCYVNAMHHGLALLNEGAPLSLRMIREIHERLLSHGRGSSKRPGEFKNSQNWIGGTRPGNAKFVPPPPDIALRAMGDLEMFLHDQPEKTRPILKAALAHVQFETIHPFLDGNGRLGRLLITFILCSEGILEQPMLYLSLHFKRYRDTYYDLLQRVRMEGVWEEWINFFLEGVVSTATEAVTTAKQLLATFKEDRLKIQGGAASVLQLHEQLQQQPILSVAKAAEKIEVSLPAATKALQKLEKIGVIGELTGSSYGELYGYTKYFDILNSNDSK